MSSSEEIEEIINIDNSLKIPLYITPKDLLKLEDKTIIDYVAKIQNLLKKSYDQIKKLKKRIENSEHAKININSSSTSNQHNNDTKNETEIAEEHVEVGDKEANDAFSLVHEMRQAAAKAENLKKFVFEPTSGLYFDQQSGYYYNAEYDLYYDGNTGCYYSYNDANGSYEFHSQVQVKESDKKNQNNDMEAEEEDEEIAEEQIEFDEWGGIITDKAILRQIKVEKNRVIEKEQSRKKRGKEAKKLSKKIKSNRKHDNKHRDHEDGELSTSNSESSDSDLDNANKKKKIKNENPEELLSSSSVPVFEKSNRFQAIAKNYPPSLRIIVRESCLEKLIVGSLNLITFKGGSLGREGNHDVIIPDANVSKNHLKFIYDEKKSMYECIDIGSRNGTILNGHTISQDKNKKKCERNFIAHGSIIEIGSTKLLCHVHEGNTTCGLCEPGLLIESTSQVTTSTTGGSNLSHKEQLKVLQKKYGLQNESE